MQVLEAVGLKGVNLDAPPTSLSDGFKRRLALAVQLVSTLVSVVSSALLHLAPPTGCCVPLRYTWSNVTQCWGSRCAGHRCCSWMSHLLVWIGELAPTSPSC